MEEETISRLATPRQHVAVRENPVFETYPKGTLRLWWGDNDEDVDLYKSKDKQKAARACESICSRLNIRLTDATEELTDDDLDAILCSLAAVSNESEQWTEDDLKRRLRDRFGAGRTGYLSGCRQHVPSRRLSYFEIAYSTWGTQSACQIILGLDRGRSLK